MSEVDTDLSNIIAILLNASSENDSIREESERQIMELRNNSEEFISQLIQIYQIPDVPLPAIRLSLILTSQMLQPHSLSDITTIRESLLSNNDLNESLKMMLTSAISNEDMVIKNFSAKSYALLFQALNGHWIDGLNAVVSYVSNAELHIFERFSYLLIFHEISELTDYEKLIFNEDCLLPKYRDLLNQCINFIGTDYSNEEVNTDIRILSSKCILNFFHISNKNEKYFINDREFFSDLINALQYSFPIPDFDLFQSLLQIMEFMIIYGYNFIDEFLEAIFNYSMNCFDIPNTSFCEATLFFWGEVAQYEFMKIIQREQIKGIIEQSAMAILQICKNIFDNANLSDVLSISSDAYSLVSTAQATITNFFKCAPATVFEIITNKFQIFETGFSPFTTFSFLSSIAIETKSLPFAIDFLLFIHDNWENILSLENQVFSEPTLSQDENMICTRAYALILLKKLVNTLYIFPKLPLKPEPENPTKKLDDIFTLIKNSQERQKQEHPAILVCYSRLIGAICYRKDKKYTQKQEKYIDDNYDFLAKYLWSLIDLNYSQFDYLLLESATKNMNILIANACRIIDHKNCILSFDFLVFLFTYSEEKLKKSNTLFESNDVRYIFQKSFCSIIGSLGKIMATDNDVCQRSFEALLSLIQNPNSLIYEEALKSVAMFIPNVTEFIDPTIIVPLTINAIKSLDSDSNQIISSASFLLAQIFKSVPEQITDGVKDSFESLQRVLFDKICPEFRESQYSLLVALASLFSNVDPHITVEFKDEFLELIGKLENVIELLNTRSEDDLKYANIFYGYLSDCFLSYVNAFMPEKPQRNNTTKEILDEQRIILKLLYNFAYNICKIPDENKTDELLDFYFRLLDAITEKTSRQNDRLLNKPMITNPLHLAEERYSDDDAKLRYLDRLENKMKRV